jgi:23S rRNA-/tRNA-specific pseudouridylate synthase
MSKTVRPNRTQLDVDKSRSSSSARKRKNDASVLGTNRILLYTNNYLCIDKPCDLRMNGDFDNSVEKLVFSTFPNLKADNVNLRWVHQLDYATSGALCIGLNRSAAARASLAFSARLTKKLYIAIVKGHLLPHAIKVSESDISEDRYSHTNSITTDEVKDSADRSQIQDDSSTATRATWQDKVIFILLT